MEDNKVGLKLTRWKSKLDGYLHRQKPKINTTAVVKIGLY